MSHLSELVVIKDDAKETLQTIIEKSEKLGFTHTYSCKNSQFSARNVILTEQIENTALGTAVISSALAYGGIFPIEDISVAFSIFLLPTFLANLAFFRKGYFRSQNVLSAQAWKKIENKNHSYIYDNNFKRVHHYLVNENDKALNHLVVYKNKYSDDFILVFITTKKSFKFKNVHEITTVHFSETQSEDALLHNFETTLSSLTN